MLSEIELQELKKITMRKWELVSRLVPANALECRCGNSLLYADGETGEIYCAVCETVFDGSLRIEDE